MFRDLQHYTEQQVIRRPCIGACYCSGACMGMKPENKPYQLITENTVDIDSPKPKQAIQPLPFDEITKDSK